MSKCAEEAASLVELALCVDALLMVPANMATVRGLVESYCDGVDREAIAPLSDRLPTNPDDPYDWSFASLDEQSGKVPPLTPVQTVAALAALRDVHCAGVERVIATRTVGSDEPAPADVRRAVGWLATLERVRKLGEWALHWFKLQFRRFEQTLSEHIPQPVTHPESVSNTVLPVKVTHTQPADAKERLKLFAETIRSALATLKSLEDTTPALDEWQAKIDGLWTEARSIPLPAGKPIPERPARVITLVDVQNALQVLLDWVDGQIALAPTPEPYTTPHKQPFIEQNLPVAAASEMKADGPYNENGEIGIRWNGDRVRCDEKEHQAWRIIGLMWPPEDRKEVSVVKVKTELRSDATHPKWGTNKASEVRKILSRVKMAFKVDCVSDKSDGIEVFQWIQVCR